MTFTQFLKQYRLSLAQAQSFSENREQNIEAIQNITNVLLLGSLAIIDEKLTNVVDTSEGFYPQKEISSTKILFEIWSKVNGIEVQINEELAYDILTKAGYNVDLNKDQLEQIYEKIQETKDT